MQFLFPFVDSLSLSLSLHCFTFATLKDLYPSIFHIIMVLLPLFLCSISITVTVEELIVKGVQLWSLLVLTFFFAAWILNDLFYM